MSLYGFCRVLACADWLLLCGRYVVVYTLTTVVVCVGVMDTCGCLVTGGVRGFMVAGVSKDCQRSCWQRSLSRRSGGCFLRIPCNVAGSNVALVLDNSCCTGKFVYCTRALWH